MGVSGVSGAGGQRLINENTVGLTCDQRTHAGKRLHVRETGVNSERLSY